MLSPYPLGNEEKLKIARMWNGEDGLILSLMTPKEAKREVGEGGSAYAIFKKFMEIVGWRE